MPSGVEVIMSWICFSSTASVIKNLTVCEFFCTLLLILCGASLFYVMQL